MSSVNLSPTSSETFDKRISDVEIDVTALQESTAQTNIIVDQRLDGIDTSLSGIVTVASKFGIDVINDDNHDKIIAALNYIKSQGGGTLQFPAGTFKTSPISFQGFDGIFLKGVGGNFPSTVNTTIKIIGTNPSGSVGIQFCDTKNPKVGIADVWAVTNCGVIGIFLDCDNKCDVGINGNRQITLDSVTVRRALVDGIVLEDFTYPVYLNKCESSFNGRHGLYVKGKSTTVYDIRNSEFTGNGAYGINIEGGATVLFSTVTVQANVVGGLKINKVAGYTGTYFLSSIIFINFYTEGNGTLLNTDPKYEGNCGVYITGYDKTTSSTGKPYKIEFYGGKINAISGGTSIKVDAVLGCIVGAEVNGTTDIAANMKNNVKFIAAASSATVPTISGDSLTSYYMSGNLIGEVFNYGLFPTRGRVKILEFYLPTIAAGATVNMNSLYQLYGISGLTKGYSMFKNGSIMGLRLVKKGVGSAGTITCKPVFFAGPTLYSDPPNDFAGGFTSLVLNCATSNKVSGTYTPGLYNFNADNVVGIYLTASADYVAGTYDGFIAQLMIEI